MKLGQIVYSIIFLTSLLPTPIHGEQEPLVFMSNFCLPERGNFTQNSFYQKNLKSLLNDLASHSSSLSFYNSTIGTAPDDIYALFFCRYDLPSSVCHACVEAAVKKVNSNCTQEKEAIVWYTHCTLRHANRNIFSRMENDMAGRHYSLSNVSMNVEQFNEKFSEALGGLINQAAYNTPSPPKYFKTLATEISPVDKLYLLVQCTPDIEATPCDQCLRSTVQYLPWRGMTWATISTPSCRMMYNLEPFFQLSTSPPAPPSPTPVSFSTPSSSTKGPTHYVFRVAIPAASGILILLGIFICLVIRRQHAKREQGVNKGGVVQARDQCVLLDFRMLQVATNKFSKENELGQGGFGIVYRGVLQNGQQVAVKRLSTISGQGTREFQTEVEVVAQLQHKNLVRLIGYSLEGEERLLVYEFMPNLSLDNFLFGSIKGAYLTWEIRYKIIQGIARGLHYLHEDSRIQIVHRDLKTSNILLDDNLDPKIADFGMARLMQVNQTQANTTNVVGTFGYIAPEYALAGRCTIKSDIYSFGVIILEILSGKSCSRFYQTSNGEGLLRHAWRAWSEDAFENLIDPVLQNKYSRNEVEKCIRVGLLCVQDDEASRPTTQALLIMLSSNSTELPSPSPSSLFPNNISMPSAENESHSGQSLYEAIDTRNTWYMEKDLYAR